MNRRTFLFAGASAAIAGCVSVPGAPGAPAPAPVYRVGDRWVYGARDGYRLPVVWDETHEVVAVGAVFDNETRVFKTPLERYEFPLTPGAVWRQTVDNYNETLRADDPLQRYVKVGGWERISTPAGSFDAIAMRVLMQLNLNDPFKYPTQCNYEIWWAPAAGASVRETKYATYREKGDSASAIEIRSQNTVLELTSFRRGAA